MNRDRLIGEFLEMVQISSLSLNEGKFADSLVKKLMALGLEVCKDDAGEKSHGDTGNVIGRLPGDPKLPTVMFCAHMDTVTPGINIKPVIRDGVIYSDGSTILGGDDKAGIAAILEALRYVKENDIPHGDIEVVFTIAEEGGMYGAKNLDYSKINPAMAFILDSGGEVGGVIVQAPAQMKIQATIHGKAAHAGVAPELGISAIQVAARAINNMKLLRIDSETTANVGTIKGGTSSNIVCDRVELLFEARSLKREKLQAQIDHMVGCINKAGEDFNTTCELNVYLSYAEVNISPDSEVIKTVERAMNRIGKRMELKATGGGSDTNVFSGNGLNAVTLAIGMTNVHTTSEYIAIQSIVDAAELVAAIIQEVKPLS